MIEPKGKIIPAPRGRILAVDRGFTLGRGTSVVVAGRLLAVRITVVIFALAMFTQCFQYMTDIPALYLLSKAWPFLTLPLAAWGLLRSEIPYKVLYVVLFFWVIAITPMLGLLHLGNSIADAMATTVKVWSFGYVFAVAGLLATLRLRAAAMNRVIIGLGIATYIIMSLLWLLVPVTAYGGGDLDTKLFMIDVERGYRIYMPMYFGVLLLFYLNRSAWMQFAWWKLVGLVLCLFLMLTIYKQRAAIASAVLALIVGSVLSLKRWRVPAITALALGACAAAFLFLTHAQNAVELKSNLGASLAVREVSVATAWDYVRANPERWLLGVGGTTRIGDVTLGKLFNNPMFFLADIGWLGVLFEYGAVGVLLMLFVYGTGLRKALEYARPGDPLAQALADYIVYLLAASVVYSAVFTPGELTTTIALSYYLHRDHLVGGRDQGIVAAQLWEPSPRQMARARSLPVGALR